MKETKISQFCHAFEVVKLLTIIDASEFRNARITANRSRDKHVIAVTIYSASNSGVII